MQKLMITIIILGVLTAIAFGMYFIYSKTTAPSSQTQQNSPGIRQNVSGGQTEDANYIPNQEYRDPTKIFPDVLEGASPSYKDDILKQYRSINTVHKGIIEGFNVLYDGATPTGEYKFTLVIYLNQNFATQTEANSALQTQTTENSIKDIENTVLAAIEKDKISFVGGALPRIIIQQNERNVEDLP